MAFEFTKEDGKTSSIEQDPNNLIALRFGDNPMSWYNSKSKSIETVVNTQNVAYPKIMHLRRSPEFKAVAETFLQNNGYELNEANLRQAGVLGEKKKVVRHDPRASKHIIWGEIISESDNEIVIRTYPPLKNEFANRSKKELTEEILTLRDEVKSHKSATGVVEDEASDTDDLEHASE